MKSIIAFILAAVFITANCNQCVTTAIQDGPAIVASAIEIGAGDYAALTTFISSTDGLCDGCGWNCQWLDQIAQNNLTNNTIHCISGIAEAVQSLLTAIATGGVDVAADIKIVVGIYNSVEYCSKIVEKDLLTSAIEEISFQSNDQVVQSLLQKYAQLTGLKK